MKTYFIRHGESTNNAESKVAGTFDCSLTEKGVKQAQSSINKIKNLGITYIISSPLKRALQTAKIVSKEINVDITVWEDLHELDYGGCQNKIRLEGCRTNLEMIVKNLCLGAETLQEIESRAKRIVEKLRNFSADSKILIVGHGTFTAMIFAVIDKKKANELLDYRLNWHYDNSEIKELTI